MNRSAFLLLAIVCLSGCAGESSEDHSSAEHFVPAHWPSDLNDAAEKIRHRTEALGPGTETASQADTEKELRDLVGWVPEVAADTDLTEQQWLPIYNASESLSKRLQRMSRPLDAQTVGELMAFGDLLERQSQWITVVEPPQHEADDEHVQTSESGEVAP